MANLPICICIFALHRQIFIMHPGFSSHKVVGSVTPPGNRPLTELIRQARQGVVRRRVDEVASLVGLTDIEMARVLNMSVRSLHSKTLTEPLTLAAGERLLLLERLVQHGLTTFEGRADLLARWLRTPLAELAYRDTGSATKNVSNDALLDAISVYQLGSFNQPGSPPERTVSVKPTPELTADTGLTDTVIAQSPLAVLDTVSGFALAEDVLGRIDWGIVG